VILGAAAFPCYRTLFDLLLWISNGPHHINLFYFFVVSFIVGLVLTPAGLPFLERKWLAATVVGAAAALVMGSMAIYGARRMVRTEFMSFYAPTVLMVWFLVGFCSVITALTIQGRLKLNRTQKQKKPEKVW
jgi:hypothetical protein